MILVDDPDVISVVRQLAVELGCSEEEAIGRAVAAELLQRAEALGSAQAAALGAVSPGLAVRAGDE
jgi:hypothetical protein